MHVVGIDIAAETHVFAIVAEDGTLVVKPTPFAADADGHAKLLAAGEAWWRRQPWPSSSFSGSV